MFILYLSDWKEQDEDSPPRPLIRASSPSSSEGLLEEEDGRDGPLRGETSKDGTEVVLVSQKGPEVTLLSNDVAEAVLLSCECVVFASRPRGLLGTMLYRSVKGFPVEFIIGRTATCRNLNIKLYTSSIKKTRITV